MFSLIFPSLFHLILLTTLVMYLARKSVYTTYAGSMVIPRMRKIFHPWPKSKPAVQPSDARQSGEFISVWLRLANGIYSLQDHLKISKMKTSKVGFNAGLCKDWYCLAFSSTFCWWCRAVFWSKILRDFHSMVEHLPSSLSGLQDNDGNFDVWN